MGAWKTRGSGCIFAARFATIDTKRLLASIACLGMFFWSTSSYAVVVGVDQFSVSGTYSSGTLNFTDTFSDGTPPPCGPGGCGSQPTFYGVNNTSGPLPPESGGLVQLNSSNGISSTNAAGGARLDETVQVSGAKSELLSTNAISMSGIFTLPGLSGPLNNGYGIRFIDAPHGSGPGTAQQILELDVQYWTGNLTNPAGVYVRYLTQDFSTHTITTIGANLLNIPTGADEIYLSLDDAAVNGQFEAQYGYVTGGTVGSLTSLGSADGFAYENYVRPQFHAFETAAATPLPAALPLFATGLGAIGLFGWRRKRKARAAA